MHSTELSKTNINPKSTNIRFYIHCLIHVCAACYFRSCMHVSTFFRSRPSHDVPKLALIEGALGVLLAIAILLRAFNTTAYAYYGFLLSGAVRVLIMTCSKLLFLFFMAFSANKISVMVSIRKREETAWKGCGDWENWRSRLLGCAMPTEKALCHMGTDGIGGW
jgi:hypothetical protein